VLYKFRSKAAGDVIMLEPNGDQLLRLIGKSPARTGIVEPLAMPMAIAALERAVAEDEAARAQAARDAGAGDDKADDATGARAISLRQRVWPMVEMMRRAQAADEPIVWGV
jgi:Domain of unknown function (DUF1840)